jgi:hypothetical protein
MLRNAGIILVAVMLTAFPVAVNAYTFRVSDAPEWDQFFQRTNGWLGADAAFSIPLATNKTLWLFGDTFVGQVQNGKRIHPRMIHSSIAIQRFGKVPRFFYPTDKKGRPGSFVKSPDGRTYFWLMDGARDERGLFFFMQQVEWTGNSVWGFRCIGTWLAYVENPDTPPARWKISIKQLPFLTLADGENVILGCETLQSGGFIYIYGYANFQNSSAEKHLILARAPENTPDDFTTWEFFSNGSWTKDFQKTTPLFSEAPPEGSVSWQPFLEKFVFVYTDGIWGKIVMRTADAPQGPWSAPGMLYQCPDMTISPSVFCYAGKAHPELSAPDELLISYAANSQNSSEVLNDARLYWPRFVRVTFKSR